MCVYLHGLHVSSSPLSTGRILKVTCSTPGGLPMSKDYLIKNKDESSLQPLGTFVRCWFGLSSTSALYIKRSLERCPM